MLSLQGAGTSYVSGAGEEGDEEVVGGAFDDLEEEVVDDRNIDEEFERVLEQQEDQPGSQPRGGSRDTSTPGKQQSQRGSTPQSSVPVVPKAEPAAGAAAAGLAQQHSPFAALHVQQPQQAYEQVQQLTPVKPEGGFRVSFADQHGQQQQLDAAAAAAAAPQGPPEEDVWEDVGAPAAFTAGAHAPAAQMAAPWQQQQQQDWQQWQQQQQPGANGAYQQQPDGIHGQKRPWGEPAAGQGMGADGFGSSGGPAAISGGPTSSQQQPSASTGGGIKKLRLSLKKEPAP
jgi:hypothetical protein